MQEATNLVARLHHLPIDTATKVTVIITKALAMGLYGCEAQPTNQSSLRHLQNVIADAIGPHSGRAAPAFAFMLAEQMSQQLDPVVQILQRRALMFRRMFHKHPRIRPLLDDIHKAYAEAGYVGTYIDEHNIGQLAPAPPPLSQGSHKWKPPFPAKGPVGFLLVSLHHAAAALDDKWCVHTAHEMPVSLTNAPDRRAHV